MPAVKELKEMSPEEIRGHAKTLRSEFAELVAKGERGDDDNQRLRTIKEEVDNIDVHLTLAVAEQERTYERAALAQLGVGPRAAFAQVGSGIRTVGGAWVESDAFKDWAARGYSGAKGFTAELDRVGMRSFDAGLRDDPFMAFDFGDDGPGNASAGNLNTLLPVGQPRVPTPRQAKLYLRDLIPVFTTTLATIPYVQELNPTSNELSATAVAEGGTKPDVTLSFQGQSASPTVIAADITMSKQLFEDAAYVVQYINNRLPYLVKFQEDNEFLNGSGNWPDIKGILNTSGVQTQSAVGTADNASTLGMAMAQVELVDGAATSVVMYPTDAWNMWIKRASTSGVFDAGNPFTAVTPHVWGLPVYRTRAMTQGTALVADFERGAHIADRQQVTIEVFPQNKDYAQRNLLYVRCEERVGLLVERPDLFVTAAVTDGS